MYLGCPFAFSQGRYRVAWQESSEIDTTARARTCHHLPAVSALVTPPSITSSDHSCGCFHLLREAVEPPRLAKERPGMASGVEAVWPPSHTASFPCYHLRAAHLQGDPCIHGGPGPGREGQAWPWKKPQAANSKSSRHCGKGFPYSPDTASQLGKGASSPGFDVRDGLRREEQRPAPGIVGCGASRDCQSPLIQPHF